MTSTPGQPSVAVSVLVPVLDESESIEETVAAMAAQRFEAGALEFVFADGRSTDDTRARLEALAERDPRIRVFDNPRRGTASGLNVCLREARGTYVARMDAHTYYPDDYLARGVARLEQGDGVRWVAGPQLAEARGPVSQGVVDALATPLGRGASKKWEAGPDSEEFDLDTGVFCGVWRRADVLAHDGWDEGWPRNQDSEMAARFLRSGERIVCVPAMGARYLPRDSVRGLWRQYRGYGEYRARTALRHPTSLRRSALLPPLVVVTLGAALAFPWRPVRLLARAGAAAYGLALGAGTAQTARAHGPARGGRVAQALATMHLGHGVGFFLGMRRWGIPWRALLVAAGAPARESERAPYDGPVDAPSLKTAEEG